MMKCMQCGTEFESPFCPRCGAPAQAVPQQVPQAPVKPPKKKRPIYRRWWFILLAILVAFILLVEITSIKPKVKWDELVLGEMLPPMEGRGEILLNDMDDLDVTISKVTAKEFADYAKQCQEMGFVKNEDGYGDFSGINAEGYELNLNHYNSEEELNISLELYEEDEDYAEDEDTETESTPTTTTTTKKADSAALGKDFKSFMDSYEKFMGEYVDFMKKYQANPTDMSLIADYSKIMNQYNQFVKDFSAWGDKDLSAAEVAYYTKVQGRVSQKLLEVAAG